MTQRATLLIVAIIFFGGCAHKAKTPFAHLYGAGWCQGVYEGYAESYDGVIDEVSAGMETSYAFLVQDGIAALERLQSRATPFAIALDPRVERIRVQRAVPERLTFTADMTAQDRERAQREFEESRAHLAEDYTDIARLEWATNRLLENLVIVRRVMEETEREIFNLTRTRALVQEGKIPFELPYQVTPAQYEEVLTLLVARLERDIEDLQRIQAGIIAVMLAVRTTDGSSGSLSSNVAAAILAAWEDGRSAPPRPPRKLPAGDSRQSERARGLALIEAVKVEPAYEAYLVSIGAARPDPVGAILSIVDGVAGTDLAGLKGEVEKLVRGDVEGVDYLRLLKIARGFAPKNSAVGNVLATAVTLTEAYHKAAAAVKTAKAIARRAKEAQPGWLVNQASVLQGKVESQIVFYKDEAERLLTTEKLSETALAKMDLAPQLRAIPVRPFR